MDVTPVDIHHKRFRTGWMGYDRQQVEMFLQEITEELQQVRLENADLRKDLQNLERELKEYRDREKAIRNVLVHAHKTAEQMKANAEKESRLIVAEAELKAEKLLQGVQQRQGQLQEGIAELKRQRVQMETKLRAVIEGYRQLLDMDPDNENESPPENQVES